MLVLLSCKNYSKMSVLLKEARVIQKMSVLLKEARVIQRCWYYE